MRQRRVARCLLRADLAIEDHAPAEARAALEEARSLGGATPELATLEQRLAELESSAIAAPEQSRRAPRAFAVGAGMVVAILAIAAGPFVMRTIDTGRKRSVEPAPAIAQAAAPAVVAAPQPQEPDLRIVHETVVAHEAVPAIVGDEPELEVRPMGAPIAPPEPAPEPEPPADAPVVAALNRREISPADPLPEPERGVTIVPSPAPIAPPVATAVATPAVPEAAPPRTDPAPSSLPKTVDERAVVRSILERYEVAYSSLDAAAASAVWPAVDRGALARAFHGLASQHVSLGSCDVSVSGPAARATCAGTATWRPKVGGGERTEPRRWSFELRKSGGAWQIERAVAR